MNEAEQFKKQLVAHLQGGEAFVPVEKLLKLIPFDSLKIRPGNLPYSFYEIFYHIWFTQKDIINYCQDNSYRTPVWPEDYWPEETSPTNEDSWKNLQKGYFEDREKFIMQLQDPTTDLLAPLDNGNKHSLLREVLLIIEHSAYHIGQLIIILRLLGVYNGNRPE